MTTDTAARIPVADLKPGDRIWLDRRTRGILGSRERIGIVISSPTPSATTPAMFFDAYASTDNGRMSRVTVCSRSAFAPVAS